jgi:transcriptional regulator with PAS, ATPase and Fis domain
VRELPPELSDARSRTQVGDTLDIKEQERRLIVKALERFGGNRTKAAKALNISAVTLWRKMKESGLQT